MRSNDAANTDAGAGLRGSQVDGPGGRVPLVDDEPTIPGGYRRALAAAGYDVEEANDGREALDLIGRMAFDVIVDIVMPNMNGVQLLRAVREHPSWRSSTWRLW